MSIKNNTKQKKGGREKQEKTGTSEMQYFFIELCTKKAKKKIAPCRKLFWARFDSGQASFYTRDVGNM